MRNYDTYRSVVENGIVTLYCQSEENSQEEIVISLPVASIIDRLNKGEWDEQPIIGVLLTSEWFKNQTEKELIPYIRCIRWMVAHLWVLEQTKKNHGKPIFMLENSPITFILSIASVRLAMENNIEVALTESFGHEQGIKHTLLFYQEMIIPTPDKGLKISDFGKGVFTAMYLSLSGEGVFGITLKQPEVLH
ncbi:MULTISPECIES: hypothetical protein [Xenorhabdus]|uniref:hypothetical protein n=1 Tax=Xenorhabdus TaxID=626 RepID=UPI00064957B0|nr:MULTISPECIES: hypothetical protein [Xenorhabdus]KLU14166.1 hypothetical protein AAY47_17890 [Xenorhabdus griffiniae]KOP32967.1 hypothetical protein AFK69_13075 [Xenorhabdus sp. GDc328]